MKTQPPGVCRAALYCVYYIRGGVSSEESNSRFGMRPNREFRLYEKRGEKRCSGIQTQSRNIALTCGACNIVHDIRISDFVNALHFSGQLINKS